MGAFKNTYTELTEGIYNFINEDCLTDDHILEIENLLSDMPCDEFAKWMGRFEIGIKILDMSTPYDADFLWGMLVSFIEAGIKDEEPLEDTWENFKAIAKENDF